MALQIKEVYAEVYKVLQENIDDVLRQHAIKELEQRVAESERNIQRWEKKYGCDHETFTRRTATDEVYLQQLDAIFETQMWEGDLFEWEFDVEVLQKWQEHLQKILTTS